MSVTQTYVVYTNPMYIQTVRQQMTSYVLRSGEEAYAPVIEKIKRIKGEDRRVQSYMFPGYLFIETAYPDDFWERIRKCMGTAIFEYCRLLRSGDYIAPISDEEQRNIHKMCGGSHVMASSVGYIEGDRLIVTDGPLKDMTGSVVKINRHKKTAILRLKLMGGLHDIAVGLEVLRRA